MSTYHDIAASKIDEALSLIETGQPIDSVRLAEILESGRKAINMGRFLTAADLAQRWRCSARGMVKDLRLSDKGPNFFRPSACGIVLYPIAGIEEFEKSNLTKGMKNNV